MFLESRFEHALGRLAGSRALPLRFELWNGRRIDLSPAPTVIVTIPKLSALRYFIAPDLNKLGEYADEMIGTLRRNPGLADVDTTLALRKPERRVVAGHGVNGELHGATSAPQR